MRKEKLALAYIEWRKHKNVKNFKRMLNDGFRGGWLPWRIWRVIKNTINGDYEKLYQEHWKDKLD